MASSTGRSSKALQNARATQLSTFESQLPIMGPYSYAVVLICIAELSREKLKQRERDAADQKSSNWKEQQEDQAVLCSTMERM